MCAARLDVDDDTGQSDQTTSPPNPGKLPSAEGMAQPKTYTYTVPPQPLLAEQHQEIGNLVASLLPLSPNPQLNVRGEEEGYPQRSDDQKQPTEGSKLRCEVTPPTIRRSPSPLLVEESDHEDGLSTRTSSCVVGQNAGRPPSPILVAEGGEAQPHVDSEPLLDVNLDVSIDSDSDSEPLLDVNYDVSSESEKDDPEVLGAVGGVLPGTHCSVVNEFTEGYHMEGCFSDPIEAPPPPVPPLNLFVEEIEMLEHLVEQLGVQDPPDVVYGLDTMYFHKRWYG